MTPHTPDPITLRQVRKHYGPVHAVDGVDLDVRRGELFGLIGHNGAGKSTLFKMMLGLIAPTSGELQVAGSPVHGSAFRHARRRIGYLPENLVLYDNLTGLETLHFFARLKGAPLASCPSLLEQVGLKDAALRPVRGYSKGMRQRLGFAQALLGDPQLLFLDEPTTGLDPAATRDFYAQLDALRARGVTMVITSHILAELEHRVDRLAIMASGRVLACGSVTALREQSSLPLTIDVRARPELAPALGARLAPLQGATVAPHADGITVTCPRALKLPVLQALTAMGSEVADLQIHEPSLEDLFFGLRSAA